MRAILVLPLLGACDLFLGLDAPADAGSNAGRLACETSFFEDDFGGGQLDTSVRWNLSVKDGVGGGHLEGGALVLQPSALAVHTGLRSQQQYLVAGTTIAIEVVAAPTLASEGRARLQLKRGAEVDYYAIEITEQEVFGYTWTPTDQVTEVKMAFDPVRRRYLRVRAENDIIYFEASADAVQWFTEGQAPAPPIARQQDTEGVNVIVTAIDDGGAIDAVATLGHVLACR